jgi:hypothetical protein
MSVATRPGGTIYDLGYKRYVGTRPSTGTRWLVIMRHQLGMGWRKWWRYKVALGLAVIVKCVCGSSTRQITG